MQFILMSSHSICQSCQRPLLLLLLLRVYISFLSQTSLTAQLNSSTASCQFQQPVRGLSGPFISRSVHTGSPFFVTKIRAFARQPILASRRHSSLMFSYGFGTTWSSCASVPTEHRIFNLWHAAVAATDAAASAKALQVSLSV